MVVGALNFSRHFLAFRNLSLRPYRKDSEGKAVLIVLGSSIVLVTMVLWLNGTYSGFADALRHSFFNVVSIATTTGFVTPMMLLQDPALTKVVIVTLPEPTPVTEARELQADLARAGITAWAWVVNYSLTAAQPQSPFLRLRAAAEESCLAEVMAVSGRAAVVPMLGREPVGEADLLRLTHQTVPRRRVATG